jgi:hypothetical protein
MTVERDGLVYCRSCGTVLMAMDSAGYTAMSMGLRYAVYLFGPVAVVVGALRQLAEVGFIKQGAKGLWEGTPETMRDWSTSDLMTTLSKILRKPEAATRGED